MAQAAITNSVFVISTTAARAQRRAIERQIDLLIELLDQLDGDVDLEDDELHDDVLDAGEGENVYPIRPRYAVDQSAGPVNALEAERSYYTAQARRA